MCRNVFLIRREVLFDIFLIRNCLLTRRKGSREIFWAGKNPRHTQTTEARCCCSFVYLSFHLGERSTISAASLSWLFKTVKHGKGSHTIPITNVVALLGRYYTLAFTQIFKKKLMDMVFPALVSLFCGFLNHITGTLSIWLSGLEKMDAIKSHYRRQLATQRYFLAVKWNNIYNKSSLNACAGWFDYKSPAITVEKSTSGLHIKSFWEFNKKKQKEQVHDLLRSLHSLLVNGLTYLKFGVIC